MASLVASEDSPGKQEVNIPDPVLEAAIRDKLGIPEGPISASDMERLVRLRLQMGPSVGSLSGIEHATNLIWIQIPTSSISDLSPLRSLSQLQELYIDARGISDISPLADLTKLTKLSLSSYGQDTDGPTDVNPLSGLSELRILGLSYARDLDIDSLSNLSNLTHLTSLSSNISDLSFLSSLSKLTYLNLRGNPVSDLTPIQTLSNLSRLILSHAQVDDISTLLSNKDLYQVNLTHNKLYLAPGSPDQEVVDALRARGVTVQVENQNPDGPEYPTSGTPNLVPSDGSPVDSDPEQFGRTVGLSGTTVLIGAEANDDQGIDSGKAYLYLDPDTGNGPVVETIQIPATDPSELNNRFGSSVSLAGSLALIGAAGNNDFPTGPGQPEGTYSGAAFVYQNIDSAPSGGHSPSAKLIRLADTRYGDLDQRADLSGTSALVSYFLEENEAGAAYLYRNLDSLSGTQTEVARLTASDGAGADASHPGDQFGFSIALESDLAIIGAPNANIESPVLPGTIISKAGAVYLFQGLDSATGEIQESAKIIEGPESDGANFGYAVALDKGNAVIGAPALSISAFM